MMCSIEGCQRKAVAHGWCSLHYNRERDAGRLPPRPSSDQRFWAKVDKCGEASEYAPHLGPCWLWTARTTRGYGMFWDGERQVYAHRFSYEMAQGTIPPGAHLDHLCRVPRCVNPAHLEPVSVRENVARSPIHNGAKTHCKWGHEFTAENTYVWNGGRICRTCVRLRARRYRK